MAAVTDGSMDSLSLSELTCFLWLCLPKKDAASWGPHAGAFPPDPSLKASAAAEEIRPSRRDSPGNTTTGGGDRSGTDRTLALRSKRSVLELHPASVATTGL